MAMMSVEEARRQFPTSQKAKEAAVTFAITQLGVGLVRELQLITTVSKDFERQILVAVGTIPEDCKSVDDIWHGAYVQLVNHLASKGIPNPFEKDYVDKDRYSQNHVFCGNCDSPKSECRC